MGPVDATPIVAYVYELHPSDPCPLISPAEVTYTQIDLRFSFLDPRLLRLGPLIGTDESFELQQRWNVPNVQNV